jgi:rare lipoprotein A
VIACCAVPAAGAAQADPLTDLAPIGSVPDAPTPGEAVGGGASLTPETTPPATDTEPQAAPADDLAGSLAELRALHDQLVAQRDAIQARLLREEARREAAERRLDAATEGLATRLVDLFDQGAQARLQVLLDLRDSVDQQEQARLRGELDPADRAVVDELAAARAQVASATATADAVRAQVRSVGTRIAALDAALEEREPMTADERARAAGKRYSIDARLVFATGPIPDIGYWGAATGGGLLTGWMGYAGAAVGGVGCSAPDPALRATGSIEQGDASWYGPGFDGEVTANGEVYDQTAMTAAHRTLPFGTIVRVFASTTGRCAFVRINDRGPFVDGRIIDLSRAAADQLGISGTAPVQLEVWSAPS